MQPPDSQSQKTDPFDSAEYYDCQESEVLSIESPEEAIEQQIDGWLSPTCDVEEEIRRLCPITVLAFSRRQVPASFAVSLAGQCFDRIAELFSEEYGDPDGGNDGFDKATTVAICAELLPVVRNALARATVWPCEKVAERSYDAEQVLSLMREHCPEWFESDLDGAEPEKTESAP